MSAWHDVCYSKRYAIRSPPKAWFGIGLACRKHYPMSDICLYYEDRKKFLCRKMRILKEGRPGPES